MSSIEDLYQQVYARPDDDDIRRVLADALLAIDDPRGELIQLQFHSDADHERRAMRLIQQHGLTWLGALRGAVIPLGYERGFLASCQTLPPCYQMIGRDEWSTVHTIELDHTNHTQPTFLVHPVMRSLRRVSGASIEVLRWLSSQTLQPSFTELSTGCSWDGFQSVFGELSHLPLQVIEVLRGTSPLVLRRDASGAWITPAELPADEPEATEALDDDDRFDDVDE